jgi:hypothetical protein
VRIALPVADILNFLVADFLVLILGMILILFCALIRVGGSQPESRLQRKSTYNITITYSIATLFFTAPIIMYSVRTKKARLLPAFFVIISVP